MNIINAPGAYLKTGGPQSIAGKSSVALNALKTGAYSRAQLLPGEQEKDFESFKEALLEDLKPQSKILYAMAVEVVNIVWRMKRLDYFETSVFRAEYESDISESEMMRTMGPSYLPAIESIRQLTPSQLAAGIDYFITENKNLAELRQAYPNHWPDLAILVNRYSNLLALFRFFSGKGTALDQFVTQSVAQKSGVEIWAKVLAETANYLEEKVEQFGHCANYERTKAKIREQRIFRLLTEDKAGRPRGDLTKAFHRLMADYHAESARHQKQALAAVSQQANAEVASASAANK